MSVQISGGPLLPAARAVRVFSDRESWLEGRKIGGLGSSDVAAILGASPYRSPWDIYLERVLEREKPIDARAEKLFRRGHREEPRVLEDFAEEVGASSVVPLQFVIVDGPSPVSASIDSFVELDGWGWGIGEMKTDVSDARWGASGTVIETWTADARYIVREDYAAQTYSEILASGLDYGVLAVRRSLDDLRHYTFLADEKLLARMQERLAEWWYKHIVRGIQPDNDGSEACARAKERIYGVGRVRPKVTRDATAEEVALARELLTTKIEVQRLQDRERKLRSDLSDAIGDAYGIHWHGGPGGMSKALYVDVAGKTLVDADRLRAEFPEVYAKVAKTGEASRQVRLYMQEK